MWFIDNWEYVLAVFYGVEKVVKVTPFKWDDIVVDGVKSIITGIKANNSKIK